MRKLWILVANSSFAQVYEVHGPTKSLHEIHHIDFPEGRKKTSEVFSDRPPRTFDSTTGARHAVVSELDYHTHSQIQLAHQISEYLKMGLTDHKYDELAIIAPTEFMGIIHNHIPEAIKKTIFKEVRKDLPLALNPYERVHTIIKYLDLP